MSNIFLNRLRFFVNKLVIFASLFLGYLSVTQSKFYSETFAKVMIIFPYFPIKSFGGLMAISDALWSNIHLGLINEKKGWTFHLVTVLSRIGKP